MLYLGMVSAVIVRDLDIDLQWSSFSDRSLSAALLQESENLCIGVCIVRCTTHEMYLDLYWLPKTPFRLGVRPFIFIRG